MSHVFVADKNPETHVIIRKLIRRAFLRELSGSGGCGGPRSGYGAEQTPLHRVVEGH